MTSDKIFSVSEITKILKECIEGFPFFSHLSIRGEISNLKKYKFGAYFDIKDEECPLPCVFFATEAGYYQFSANDGDSVIVSGRLGVYPKGGRYQFYVTSVKSEGLGDLLARREALKKKLAAEGLFDESRKRPLPKFPRRIGVITAFPSAASSDIINNARARYPLGDIIIYPTTVQGESAPASIIKSLELAQKGHLDLLIIARGGGSIEDLSCFDDERVVRAVAASKVVTVTAVGHEIDFTLVDFVSDKRVSTPTAAASMVLVDLNLIKEDIIAESSEIIEVLSRRLVLLKEKINNLASRPYFKDSKYLYSPSKERINGLVKRMELASNSYLAHKKERINGLASRLNNINPERVLKRGYSLTSVDGKLLTSVKELKPGAIVKTRLSDGIISSRYLGEENGK